MKKSFFTLAIATFVMGSILISCKPNTEKEQEAQESVDSAKVAVTKDEERKEFKDDTNAKNEENNAKIAELKLRIKKTGKEIDKSYQNSIDTMEQKNNDLKAKLDSYKNDVDSDWQSFKREFNHDIDLLGQSLKDFTVNNKN